MSFVKWKPHTCGCVIEGDFDTYEVKSIAPCAEHKHLPPSKAFVAAHRKNDKTFYFDRELVQARILGEGEGRA